MNGGMCEARWGVYAKPNPAPHPTSHWIGFFKQTGFASNCFLANERASNRVLVKARFEKYTPGRVLSGPPQKGLATLSRLPWCIDRDPKKSGAGHRSAVSEGAVWSFFSRKYSLWPATTKAHGRFLLFCVITQPTSDETARTTFFFKRAG